MYFVRLPTARIDWWWGCTWRPVFTQTERVPIWRHHICWRWRSRSCGKATSPFFGDEKWSSANDWRKQTGMRLLLIFAISDIFIQVDPHSFTWGLHHVISSRVTSAWGVPPSSSFHLGPLSQEETLPIQRSASSQPGFCPGEKVRGGVDGRVRGGRRPSMKAKVRLLGSRLQAAGLDDVEGYLKGWA